MPRGKKGGRGTPRGGRGGRGNIRGRGNHGQSSPALWQQAGFTLMEAARETSRHDHKMWDSNNLRTKPVTFVSAGNSEPLKQLEDIIHHEDTQPVEEPSPEVGVPLIQEDNSRDVEEAEVSAVLQSDSAEVEQELPQFAGGQTGSNPRSSPVPFFFDVVREPQTSLPPAQTATIEDRPLSRQSNSSDEVILFRGRDSRSANQSNEQISLTHLRQEIVVLENQMQAQVETESHGSDLLLDTLKPKKNRGHRRDQRPPKRSTSHDDALIADYIENMRENGEEDVLLQMVRNQQDIGGSDYIPSEESDVDAGKSDKQARYANVTNDNLLEQPRSGMDDQYRSESELDDETLAQLLAGHELGQSPNPFAHVDTEDSASSDEPQRWVDDLDVMDWDRPSLQQRKGKGARGRIRIEVSDSELEQTLEAAWKNDRFKKAERKRQREEMRSLGQLGRNAKPEDLRAKYPHGISIDEVAEEMRTFLQGTSEILALPPMDKHARKVIHDLASKFNIKSKSVGNADNRRPTLCRTKRTQQYSAASFDQAVNRINRRYFPRMDGRRGKGTPRTVGSGRVNMAAATVQDGEIVGATAPELGIENRGRAMLEKMGWSQGTALGATDNKGILQPVSHAMKRSKAGLG